MKGSIRFVVGMLMVFGAVGGLDAGSEVLPCVALAIIGMGVMRWGIGAMENSDLRKF
jgi:hypothetical protein